jgi:hypothetical protein
MKAMSWLFILLPTPSFGLWLVYQHEPIASRLLGILWLVSTILCLGWGLYIRRRHRVLAWLCGAVGLLHVGLLALPAFMPAKMRAAIACTQPNKPDPANECRAGLLASSDVGRAALIVDLGR